MADVFISYHRSEGTSALVRRIADELETIGISCWYDTKDPNMGYFIPSIMKEIESCKIFLLILDTGANESKYVLHEIHAAFSLYWNQQLIPIPYKIGQFRMADSLKFYLAPLNILNGGTSPEKASTEELIRKIADILGKTSVWILKPPARIINSGTCGSLITYVLDENGILTISGYGTMRDYNYIHNTYIINTPWWNQCAMISLVRIENGVTSIGNRAFSSCDRLTSITIPDSVSSIGVWAFHNCNRLTSVTIPYGVQLIETSAFRDCSSLMNIGIPDSVTSIGVSAFRDCSSLMNVQFPKRLNSIARRTFSGCVSLSVVALPNSVTKIGESAFEGCVNLQSIDIPDSVTSIEYEAFRDCVRLTRVIVPAKAKIAEHAFPDTTIVIRRE